LHAEGTKTNIYGETNENGDGSQLNNLQNSSFQCQTLKHSPLKMQISQIWHLWRRFVKRKL